MPKVLVADKLSPAAIQIFADRGIEADVKLGLTPEQLIGIIGGYDGLVVRSGTKVTAELLKAATRLKVVGRAGIGIDNIDVHAATAQGVVVMNTPYGNSITTAEHTIALLFAVARELPQANASVQAGQWEKSRFTGIELTGKSLGLIGCGNIGAIVADRALGLKMKVLAFDPFLSADRARELGIDKVDLDTLFARADFISLHAPLTEATRDIINAGSIAKMKKGVRIVNCARGGMIVESELLAALESGQVAGAALDVFKVEPPIGNPLLTHAKVVCTPHLGATSSEAQENVALQIAEQMVEYLLTGAVVNGINMPAVSAEDAPKLRPYLKLASQLGGFAGQLTDQALSQVVIEFSGAVAQLNTKPLVAVVLEGLLAPTNEAVNMVNAPLIARERNIKVLEVRSEGDSDYQTLIRVTVTTEEKTRSVSGTLFGGDQPRLVEIKGIPIEAELGANMLYVTNQDKPGFIGALGSLLGGEGVNIATFHLGRAAAGGDAILLAQVDQKLTDDIIAKVRALPQVVQAKALEF